MIAPKQKASPYGGLIRDVFTGFRDVPIARQYNSDQRFRRLPQMGVGHSPLDVPPLRNFPGLSLLKPKINLLTASLTLNRYKFLTFKQQPGTRSGAQYNAQYTEWYLTQCEGTFNRNRWSFGFILIAVGAICQCCTFISHALPLHFSTCIIMFSNIACRLFRTCCLRYVRVRLSLAAFDVCLCLSVCKLVQFQRR